jgi:protein SCO1/2
VLTAQTGQTVSRNDLEGKIWVADFIFTNCTGPCPRMSSQMHQVQEAVKNVLAVNLVSFTVDPARDTPEVLAAYARRFRADPARWLFLTGEQKILHTVQNGGFRMGAVDGSLSHSTHFVLVDRHSHIRGYYGSFEADTAAQLVADIRALAHEHP